jgi:uncharacterized protein YndB with AHSA1/START domain
MVDISGEIVIARPIEDVFATLADVRNEPLYNSRVLKVEKVSPGPIGPGTRFRQRARSMGRTQQMLIEITKYLPPHRLSLITWSSAMRVYRTATFEAVAGGTRARYSWSVQPRGLAVLLTPVFAVLSRHLERGVWESIKMFLEQRPATKRQHLDEIPSKPDSR